MAASSNVSSFADASTVTQLSSHAYEAFFPDEWCIGSVPHGGFITTTFLRVAALHFKTTLAAQNQPDTIAVQLNFLRRTQVGPALFEVRDAKIGAGTSIIHIALIQSTIPEERPPFKRGKRREEVVGYFTQSNMATMKGLSRALPTELTPAPPPVDFKKLTDGTDPNWERFKSPYASFRRAVEKVWMNYPRHPVLQAAAAEQWLRLANGEKWTNVYLGYVADIFRFTIEDYKAEQQRLGSTDEEVHVLHWYPTLLLNLEIKKRLPEEGVDWLYSRVNTKQVKDGRLDLELIIMDEAGEIVALSQHVCMIVNSSRNLAVRNEAPQKDKSKI